MRSFFAVNAALWMRLAPVLVAIGCVGEPAEPDDALDVESAAISRHDGRWTRLATTGPAPSERSTPAVAAIGHIVYVFGGARDDSVTGDTQIYDDLHRFDTVKRRWDVLTPTGAKPPPRVFAASAAHRASRRMLVFGGAFFGPFFSDFSAYGDLWAYNVDDNRWTELVASNAGPSPRSRPSAWVVDDKLYVFGGITSFFQVLNDLWVYDLHSNAWTELIPVGAAGSPPARHEAMIGSRGGRLILYGGEAINEQFQFLVLDDTWELALATRRWKNVTPAPGDNVAPPRNYGTAVTIGDSLYLQGGDTPVGVDCGPFPQHPTSELWRFDLHDRVWTQQFPGGDPLARLKRINSARVAGSMYIFGGYDFACDGGVTPRQIWNHDVYRFTP
jgi:hypothetical protein